MGFTIHRLVCQCCKLQSSRLREWQRDNLGVPRDAWEELLDADFWALYLNPQWLAY